MIDKDLHLILASNSPRRRELLALLNIDYSIAEPRRVVETVPADMPADKVPAFLSRLKADAYKDLLVGPKQILVTADTLVICDDMILGKPADRDAAIAMLKRLSAKTHTVITGVTFVAKDADYRYHTFDTHTLVTFDRLSDEEIEHYVDSYRPFDKAGAYGIQEWIGCVGISGIQGCFYNVMGLPLNALYRELQYFSKQ